MKVGEILASLREERKIGQKERGFWHDGGYLTMPN